LNDGFHQFFHVPEYLPKRHEVPGRSLRSAPHACEAPARPRRSDRTSHIGPAHVAFDTIDGLGLRRIAISGLTPTTHTIAVCASQWPSPNTTQHSLPGGRYPLPGPDFHRLDHASFPGAPMAGLCVPLSTLHAAPRDAPRMTRGQHDSLHLCCQGLAPFTPLPVSRRTPHVHDAEPMMQRLRFVQCGVIGAAAIVWLVGAGQRRRRCRIASWPATGRRMRSTTALWTAPGCAMPTWADRRTEIQPSVEQQTSAQAHTATGGCRLQGMALMSTPRPPTAHP
jgi:hypothetical protein